MVMSVSGLIALGLGAPALGDTLTDKAAALEKAHVAVDPIKSHFMKTLKAAVNQKGIHGAIDQCKIDASKITENASIEVGRTSLKIRNPENKPRDWMMPTLKKYESWKPGQPLESEILVPIGKEHVGYMEPIIVKPLCLHCHGKSLSPAVKSELKESYPQDKATGFSVGDLRGFFWAEFKP